MCVLSFDDGMVAASWYAWLALRSRVSMSAIGSVIVMGRYCLSRRGSSCAGSRRLGAGPLGDQWCSVGEVVERPGCRDPRRAERVAGPPGRSPGRLADARELPGVRHLPQADPAQAELAEDRVRPPAPLAAGVPAHRELGRAGRLVDKNLLGHLSGLLDLLRRPRQRVAFTTVWPAKGNPSSVSSSRPSSSVVAVVTRVMSMPRGRSILSTSISRNIDCSVRPNV